MSEVISDKDSRIEELIQEIHDTKIVKNRLIQKVDDLKDTLNEAEKRILEQSIFQNSLEKDVERQQTKIHDKRCEIQLLEEKL